MSISDPELRLSLVWVPVMLILALAGVAKPDMDDDEGGWSVT